MNYDLNMPLSDLVAKLLQGEADELHEEDLHAYMDNLTHGDKKGLQQALKEVEKSIVEWKDTYFVETYADKVRLYQQGKLKWTQRELDDLDQIRALQAIINGMLRVTLLNQVTRYRAPIDPKNS